MTDATIQGILESARRERKKSRRVNLVFALSLLALLGAIIYVLTSYEVQTACSTSPSSHECQRIRAGAAKAQTKRVACIPFHQVGYLCPAPKRGRPVVRKHHDHKGGSDEPSPSEPTGTVPSGGSGSAPASSDGSGRSSGGSVGAGGQGPGPSPDPDPSPPPPEPPPPPSSPPPSKPDPSLGDTAGQAVDQATGVVCNTLGVCIGN